MSDQEIESSANVERLPGASKSSSVSDELNAILMMLREACPNDAMISFDFDGKLHAHIDVHRREEVFIIKNMLPKLGDGLFHSITIGDTPHHPLFHRITALVNR